MYFSTRFKSKIFHLKEEYSKVALQLLIFTQFGLFFIAAYFMLIYKCPPLLTALNVLNVSLLCGMATKYTIYYVETSLIIGHYLKDAAVDALHEASMNSIKKIFADKWLVKSQKIKILMDVDNLKVLVSPRIEDATESIEERDRLFISLMQQYLSEQEIRTVLSRPMEFEDGVKRNIFAWLVVGANVKLMKQFLALPGFDSNQKYEAFMNASNEAGRSSVLLVASATLSLSLRQALPDFMAFQNRARKMIAAIIKASDSFTPEQKLVLLMHTNAVGHSPVSLLKKAQENKLARALVSPCTADLTNTGGVLYQLARQKNIPGPLLYKFISFAAIPNSNYHLRSMELSTNGYKTGLEKAKKLKLNL